MGKALEWYTCRLSTLSYSITPRAALGLANLIHLLHPQLEFLVLALFVGMSFVLYKTSLVSLLSLSRSPLHLCNTPSPLPLSLLGGI